MGEAYASDQDLIGLTAGDGLSASGTSLTTSLDALLRFCGGRLAGKAAHSFGYGTIFAAACAALGTCPFTKAPRPPLPEGEP